MLDRVLECGAKVRVENRYEKRRKQDREVSQDESVKQITGLSMKGYTHSSLQIANASFADSCPKW